METFLPLLIILFLVIFPLFARRKRAAAVRQFLNRKKQNKESNEMKELAKRLIGEDCIIYTITSESGSIQGVLKEVADWSSRRRRARRKSSIWISSPASGNIRARKTAKRRASWWIKS